jgi:porin-like protein
MKMLKSLILGTAAVFAASWGAQAADLPVKAKPVEYVKVCSAYGAGFYYIPGTEICLRVGGYVWYDLNINQRGEGVDIGNSPQVNNNYGSITTRVRMIMIMDARTNTQYGTLRSYVALGEQWTSCGSLSAAAIATGSGANGCAQNSGSGQVGIVGDSTVYYERAFIQIAGFTFGYVGSFFDFNPNYAITSLNTTSFKWTPLIAYTAQLGNGASTTLSIEDSSTRRSQIGGCTAPAVQANGTIGANSTAPCGLANAGLGGIGLTGYGGNRAPVLVWNLRVDQPWGSAQVAVSGHEVIPNQSLLTIATPTRWGWAIMGGIEVKTPTGPGDSIMLQGVWGQGSAEYTGITNFPVLVFGGLGRRNSAGQGPIFDIMDSYVTAAGQQQLVQNVAVNGQFRHFWTPAIRSAWWLGYNGQQMPAAATAANYPDLQMWQAGMNTIWSPVKDLDLGLELMYTNIRTTCAGCAGVGVVGGVASNNTSADVWSGLFRARRNW